MNITPRFIQRSCVEGDGIDMRQARAVLTHKPDIILFELPAGESGPGTVFNAYPTDKKPLKKVDAIIKKLNASATRYPYAVSDIAVWENIKDLWARGHDVQVYYVDAPDELRRTYSKRFEPAYAHVRTDWLFWVYLYLRERWMTDNITKVLKSYKKKKNPTIAVFLQSIHWKHVKFLLRNPSQEEMWRYYFGKFSILDAKTIDKKIRERNPFLYTWWKRVSVRV